MKKNPLTRHIRRYIWIAMSASVLSLALGYTIVVEGYHLFNAPTANDVNDIVEQTQNYKYIKVNNDSLQYTDIDMLLEGTTNQKRYKGYVMQLKDKYMFVFLQDNIQEKETLIIRESYFSNDNHLLFKENVYEQLMVSYNMNRQQVESMFVHEVYVDIQGRIKEDMPVVVLWLTGLSLMIIASILFAKEYYLANNKLSKYKVLHYGELTKVSKRLYINQRAFVYIGFSLKILYFDQMTKSVKSDNQLIVYFKDSKLNINANEETINNLYDRMHPEVLTN